MTKRGPALVSSAAVFCLAATSPVAAAPYLIVGLDQKMAWDTTGRPAYSAPGTDSVVILDLARPEAPRIAATLPLENSVQGPPTNLAISPDNRIALVASSVTNVAKTEGGYDQVPTNRLFVVDLKAKLPRLLQTLTVGQMPSGLSINAAGTLALVAYRGETSVGVFRIERNRVREVGRVDVREAPSHVAFTPDGRRALVVKQDADKVALLDVAGESVTYETDLPTADGPYNVEVAPNGQIGVVSARGVLTIVDLQARPAGVIDTVKVEAGSEGLAISPRGDLAVSVALRGSNAPPTSSVYNEHGAMVVLRIEGAKLTPIKTIELGRVPEAVAFSPNGEHLYVANFYDNDAWIFRVEGTNVMDTGKRLALPGRPASARATPGERDARLPKVDR